MDLATKNLIKRSALGNLAIFVLSVGIATLISSYIILTQVSFFFVVGASMEPTLHNGETIAIKKADDLERGNLIFFHRPPSWAQGASVPDEVLVKRVIAIPGDKLAFDGKDFRVNDRAVFSPAGIYDCSTVKSYSKVLAKDEVFVLGDNHAKSRDSGRRYCDGDEHFLVPLKKVIDSGKVLISF